MNSQKCISDADIGRLLEDDLALQEKQAFEQHIEVCPQCKTRWQQASAGAGHLDALFAKAAGAYEKQSDDMWSEYAASQILSLLAMVPDQVNELVELLNIKTVKSERSATIIDLLIFKPVESQAKRLAAATGEGFSVQTFKQDEPPFEFELAQFGEQLRITARSAQEDSPYENCLARLKLLEQDNCRWSQIILIEKGEGKCVLEPQVTRGLRPKEKHLALKLEPIVTSEQLAAAGSQAYRPILSKLLKHKDPKIRCAAVKVAARIYGLEANSLIEPLANDENQMVRQAVEEVLNQFPGSQD